MAREGRLGALAYRELRLLFGAQLASSLGDGVSGIAVAFAVLGSHDSATALSVVFAIGALPQLVLILVGGALADRAAARQRLMLLSDGGRAVLQLAIAAAILAGPVPLWGFALQSFLWNAADALFRPALAGLVPQTVPEERRQDANGLLASTPSVGIILGAALGGAAVAAVGPAWALAADALTFLVSAALLARMRVRSAPRELDPAGQSLVRDVREGWGEVRARPWLLVGTVAEGFYSLLVVPAIIVLGPLLAKRELGGAGAWGAIDACFGLGMLLGGIVVLRFRPRRLLVAAYTSVLLLIPHLALLAIVAPVWLIALATVPGGLCVAVWSAFWDTAMQQEVPEERLSRVASIAHLGFFAFYPLGFALVGPLVALVGIAGAFWLACACVVANMVAVLSLPSARALVRRVEVSP